MMTKIGVMAPNGRRSWPYRLEGRVLIKRVTERHIFRLYDAVGIDESVWQDYRDCVDRVRFEFESGLVKEIEASEFERESFLHGNDQFALTRFIPLARLKTVRAGMLPLFAA
jgi:hypothetical protein